MARGFLSGVLWGGVVGVAISGTASVLAPPPQPPEVSAAAPGAAQAPDRVEVASSGEQGSDSDRAVVTPQVAPQAPAPDPDTLGAMTEDATQTAGQPETGNVEGLGDPVATADQSDVSVQADAPVLPNPQALAPMAPQDADELSISTEPAQPPAPEVTTEETAFDATTETDTAEAPQGDETEASEAEADPVAQDQTTETTEQTDAADPLTEGVSAQAPEQPQSQDDETQTAALLPEPEVQPVAPPTTVVPEAPSAPEVAQEAIEPEAAPQEIAEDDAAEPETAQEEAVAPEPATQETDDQVAVRPQIGRPAGTLTDRTNGVAIRRPGVATLGEVDEGEPAETVADAGATTEADPRPIIRFAQDYDAPGDKPLMAIVLIDDGTSPVAGEAGIAALASFPYPLTFAVDASLEDAAERMTTYRGAGFEVLAMIDLPEGAQASDAETTLGVLLARMSEVVGVLEGTEGGLQGSREVADQVTSIVKSTGHGLLTQNRGLNTMPKLARKEGVPADPVFRDFDSKGQNARVIRRFLDQAAFKAGQEGGVVMLGRLRPDTVSALLLWGLQDRAGSVAMVPISAVLTREQ